MDIQTTIGVAALIVGATASVIYTTIIYRHLIRTRREADDANNSVRFYYGLLVQTGDIMLRNAGVTDASGRPLMLHTRVSFTAKDSRRKGDVVFNVGDDGQISKTVPICIQTKEGEKFMPSLVADIRTLKRGSR